MKTTLAFLLILIAAVAHSENQEPPAPPVQNKKLISFEGFVQFADGSSSVISLSGEKDSVKYSTPIYEDTKIKLEPAANIKFVTKQNCVVVVYGEGVFSGPQGEKPWVINTKAARFICSSQNEEKFVFHGVEVTPLGETLIEASGKIFVVTGSAKLSKPLASRKIYQISKAGINLDASAQSPQAHYDFDNLYKVPKEGEKLQKPKALVPAKYRISFGPEFGKALLIHANGYLNHYNYFASGPRLQYSFRKRESEGAYIIGLRFLSVEENKNNGNYYGGGGNSPGYSSASDRLRSYSIDGGYRFNFDRWWSPFFHAGLSWMRNELSISSNTGSGGSGCGGNCSGYYSDQSLDYFGITAGFGYDFLLRPSWLGGLGFFGSAELELNQTVHPTTNAVRSIYVPSTGSVPNEATNEHGPISNFNGLMHLGLMYQW